MIGRALVGAVVLAAAASPAPAAPAVTVFTNTDEVRACLPLAGGAALVGTAGGLVERGADQQVRRVWTASDGLPGTRIDALVADGDRIWIGAEAGVAEWNGGAVRAVAGKPVRDVARWQGRIYLATWDGGVIEPGGAAVAMRGGPAAARMRASALAVSGGALWAGTTAGLYRMRSEPSDAAPDRVDGPRDATAAGGHRTRSGRAGMTLERVDGPRDVTALLAAGDALWIGASDGLWLREAGELHALGGGEVRRLAIVDGAVVAAGADGLVTVDRGRIVPLPGAPRGFAQAIAAGAGTVCTGGLDGLWTRSRGVWRHAASDGGPPSSDISAVIADGARLWVGTFDRGLASYDPERGWHRIAGTDARINALALDPRPGAPGGAHLWVATAQGVQVVDAAGGVVLRLGKSDGLPSRSVLSIARLGDGRIVVGTSVGAALVDGGQVRRVGPRGLGDRPIGNVWAIAETSAGLWLGTTTGLYRGPATAWTSKDGTGDPAAAAESWRRMSVATGHLPDDWITALTARGDAVFAGTYNGGVVRIDGDAATTLGGGWVNPSGLVWDGDRLLAATMDGLVAGDGRAAAWRAIPGLPGRDTTAALRVGRTLWVATRRGLVSLD